MAVTPNESSLLRIIQDLQRQVDELSRRVFYSVTISEGGLKVRGRGGITVEDSDGDTTLNIGLWGPPFDRPDGSPQPVTSLNDDRGNARFQIIDYNPHDGAYRQQIAMYDYSSNLIFADDVDSGQGLARPYIPVPFSRVNGGWFEGSSGTFARVWEANVPKQQPKLHVRMLTGVTSAGTVGEYRVVIGGNPVTTWQQTFDGVVVDDLDVDIPGQHMDIVQIGIEYRRVSGTGNVRCHVTDMWQRQS